MFLPQCKRENGPKKNLVCSEIWTVATSATMDGVDRSRLNFGLSTVEM